MQLALTEMLAQYPRGPSNSATASLMASSPHRPMRTFVAVPTIVFLSLSPALARAGGRTVGGAHLGYALGGGLAVDDGGFRHGLDFALMPVLFATKSGAGPHSLESVSGYTAGLSGIYGFGRTSSYLALDFGPAASSMGGGFAGVGVVYRFPKDERTAAYGVEGRVALDVLFVQIGLRLILVGSSHSSEANLLFSVGVGRF